MSNDLYPLLFEPVFRDYIWGDRRLETLLGRVIPPGRVAESWEISGHPSSPTKVTNGPLAGQPLNELVRSLGTVLVGQNSSDMMARDRFPVLIKLLDAQQELSLQVHPDDSYALEHEGEPGKTEMWYVLYAEPGAALIHGLRPGVTPESLLKALNEGSVPSQLRHVPVQRGDCIFVPAGTVHALLAGLLVAEIQENSDATYRVYDWGRLGADGKPRPLHLEKALQVINFGPQPEPVVHPEPLHSRKDVTLERLVSCDKFEVQRLSLEDGAVFMGECDGLTFEIWGVIDGCALVRSAPGMTWPVNAVTLEAVAWTLLPATLGGYEIAAKGNCTLLRIYVPARPTGDRRR